MLPRLTLSVGSKAADGHDLLRFRCWEGESAEPWLARPEDCDDPHEPWVAEVEDYVRSRVLKSAHRTLVFRDSRGVVGAAGVRAVWVLAQTDTALQRTVLHRMMESGPEEALAADVGVLEDRVRLQSGRKQLYGSQLRTIDGKLVPAPIEDSAHVDMRRNAAGLPSLRQAICVAR